MTLLADLQREFQEHVLTGRPDIIAHVCGSEAAPAATRLAVYVDAYRLRLIDALASSYPQLQRLLGADAFAQLARRYVECHPSSFRSIRWFGAELHADLEITHPDEPWLADLAAWEWTLGAAFDARDATPLDPDSLGGVAPDRWPGLRFEFHPSVRRIALGTNAPALYKSLAADEPPAAARTLGRPQAWLIWRQDLKTNYRSVEREEDGALEVVWKGGEFGAMCESLCASRDAQEVPLRAAGLLKAWVVEGLIIDARIGASAP